MDRNNSDLAASQQETSNLPPAPVVKLSRGRPTKEQAAALKAQKNAAGRLATAQSRERKEAGEMKYKKKDWSQESVTTSPRVTRKKVQPTGFQIDAEDRECSPRDAIILFSMNIHKVYAEERFSTGSPDINLGTSYNVQILDNDKTPYMVLKDPWISETLHQLNRKPFQRNPTTLQKMQIYNANWRNWILNRSAIAVNNIFHKNKRDPNTGIELSVNLRNILADNDEGIMQFISNSFGQPGVGPPLPIPEKVNQLTPAATIQPAVASSSSSSSSTAHAFPRPTSLVLSTPQVITASTFLRDSPKIRQLLNNPSTATFGDYKGSVVTNFDMISLREGERMTERILGVGGSILSEKHRTGFLYMPSMDFSVMTTGDELWKFESARKSDEWKQKIMNARSKIINRIVVSLVTFEHFVMALVDTTSYDIVLYDPLRDGGSISISGEDIDSMDERALMDQDLCHQLQQLHHLLAVLMEEDTGHWLSYPSTWQLASVPKDIGVQEGEASSGIYNLLYLGIFGGQSDFRGEEFTKMCKTGPSTEWSRFRNTMFDMIESTLAAHKQLKMQPNAVDTPVTSLGKNVFANLNVTTPTHPHHHDTESEVKAILSYTSKNELSYHPVSPSESVFDDLVDIGQEDQSVVTTISQRESSGLEKISKMKDTELQMKAGKVGGKKLELSYFDLSKLCGNRWLNDSVVLASALITQRKSRSIKGCLDFTVIDPQCVSSLIANNVKAPRTGRKNSLWSQINEIRKTGRLVIPYCINENHWICYVFNYPSSVLSVFDPYRVQNEEIGDESLIANCQKILTCVSRVLQEGVNNSSVALKVWQLKPQYETHPKIPPQHKKDMSSCGVFVCLFIETYFYNGLDKNVLAELGSADSAIRNVATKFFRERMLSLFQAEFLEKDNQ